MGFSGIVVQILLLREFLVVFSGNKLAIGIILANWLILEAFGSLFVGKTVEHLKHGLKPVLKTLTVIREEAVHQMPLLPVLKL